MHNKKRMGWVAAIVLMALPAVVQCAQAETKKSADAKTLARGKYMVQTGHCNNCHTPDYIRKEGNMPEAQWLVGSAPLGFRGAWGTTYASNLRLTVAKFSRQQWVKYVKEVKTRPPMPWWTLHVTTDADLGAIAQRVA